MPYCPLPSYLYPWRSPCATPRHICFAQRWADSGSSKDLKSKLLIQHIIQLLKPNPYDPLGLSSSISLSDIVCVVVGAARALVRIPGIALRHDQICRNISSPSPYSHSHIPLPLK